MHINNKRTLAMSHSVTLSDYKKSIRKKVGQADSPKTKVNILFDEAKNLFSACRQCEVLGESTQYYLTALDFLTQAKPYSEMIKPDLFLETRVKILVMLNNKAVAHLSEMARLADIFKKSHHNATF